jgi:hypothetical protein
MKKIQLSIPEPCHENWDTMTPTQQGRYCNACAKEVIDFSNMSDRDVLNYFVKKKDDTLCGRAFPDQLDRTITVTAKKKWYWYWNYAAALFFFLAKSNNAAAQKTTKHSVIAIPNVQKKFPLMVGAVSIRKSFTVIGKINDGKGQPVPYASVKILHSGNGISADESGKFAIKLDSVTSIIEVSALGHTTKLVTIKDLTYVEVVLEKANGLMKEVVIQPNYLTGRVGGMMICRVSRRKILSDTIKSWINNFNPSIKIYPNPLPKGNSFTITMKLKQTGSYTIQIMDAAGRLLTENKITATSKEWKEQITSSSTWSAGIHYVKLVDEKGKLVSTGSLLIQ